MKIIDKNIWAVETKFKLFGADFGNRMTVIRLRSGGLLLHSPVKICDEMLSDVKELGYVSYIVTPNNFHGLFAEEWRAKFPQAKYFTAKQTQDNNDSSFSMSTLISECLGDEIAIIKIEGAPKANEYAFVHKESSTLILTDIAFNIRGNASFWTKVFFKLNGAFDKFGPSRLMKTMITDPEALNTSIDEMLAYDINRIIVSHGDILESNASVTLREAFADCVSSNSAKSTARFSLSRCG